MRNELGVFLAAVIFHQTLLCTHTTSSMWQTHGREKYVSAHVAHSLTCRHGHEARYHRTHQENVASQLLPLCHHRCCSLFPQRATHLLTALTSYRPSSLEAINISPRPRCLTAQSHPVLHASLIPRVHSTTPPWQPPVRLATSDDITIDWRRIEAGGEEEHSCPSVVHRTQGLALPE